MRRISTNILLAAGTAVCVQATQPPYANLTYALPATGNGSAYASACALEHWSYASASSAQSSRNKFTTTLAYTYDGLGLTVQTFFQDASTLCDGKPRVKSSPAIPISTRTSTVTTAAPTTKRYTETQISGPIITPPSCSISPVDCDPLWADYSRSLEAPASQITAPPLQPPCGNSSFASSEAAFHSSMYGCGKCTIFGEGVQLVYFPVPTTVSRDMCAKTPSASLTHYGPGAVITAYAGDGYSGHGESVPGQKTAVVNGHTFTSGTAYISIASVWASDRCSSTHGPVVTNAILAMPSESVLSLRYTQNHMEYFFDQTTTQTGYPVSYADFNEPVPYSAWNGQSTCRAPDDGWSCQTIYEGMYRPQLAIPPGIRDLAPQFKGCVFWYRGLFDPPLALTEVSSEALPTLPGKQTGAATAMPDITTVATPSLPTHGSQYGLPGSGPQSQIAKETQSPQSSPHHSNHHNEGSNSESWSSGDDHANDGNHESQSNPGGEGSGSHGSVEQSSGSGHQSNHQEQDVGHTQVGSSAHTDAPHHAPDDDETNGYHGPSAGNGEPSQSSNGDTHTSSDYDQGGGSPDHGGMESSSQSNEVTADSQASSVTLKGGYIVSGTGGSGEGAYFGASGQPTVAESASPTRPAFSNPYPGYNSDGEYIGTVTTSTASETAGPAQKSSGSEAATSTGAEGRSGGSDSAATASNSDALDQQTQSSGSISSSISGKAPGGSLTSQATSTAAVIESQSPGTMATASTSSTLTGAASPRDAPLFSLLLSVVFFTILMVSTIG